MIFIRWIGRKLTGLIILLALYGAYEIYNKVTSVPTSLSEAWEMVTESNSSKKEREGVQKLLNEAQESLEGLYDAFSNWVTLTR